MNEDSRKPEYKKFHYFATGFKLEQEDYSCKIVFTENKEGEIFYDQSLSTIEKGKLVDILKKTNVEKKKPDNSMEEMPGNENAINPLVSQDDSLNTFYDKRLINICQVPQKLREQRTNGMLLCLPMTCILLKEKTLTSI